MAINIVLAALFKPNLPSTILFEFWSLEEFDQAAMDSDLMGDAKTFDSWDRFCLPLPFTRVTVVFGRPIHVARDIDKDQLEIKRQELEEEMLWAQAAADAIAQGKPTPPSKRDHVTNSNRR